MAGEDQNGGTTDAPPAKRSQAASDEPRYTVAELKENARGLLDCSPHAVAGAFYDVGADKTFTAEAAKKKVESFTSAKVEGADA